MGQCASFSKSDLNYVTKETFVSNNKYLAIAGLLTYGFRFNTPFTYLEDDLMSARRKMLVDTLSVTENDIEKLFKLTDCFNTETDDLKSEVTEIIKFARASLSQTRYIRREIEFSITETFIEVDDIREFMETLGDNDKDLKNKAGELLKILNSLKDDEVYMPLNGPGFTRKEFFKNITRYDFHKDSALTSSTVDFYSSLLINIIELTYDKTKRMEELISPVKE